MMKSATRPVLSRANLCALQCQPMDKASGHAFSSHECQAQLAVLDGWHESQGAIERQYALKDFRANIAFVNALAWMFESEDHHPEMRLTYRDCTVRLNTHSVNGISLNDFICAAKADALFERR
jgi:4a-hydroxytetrahydrobiopterin dehydratase